MGNLISTILRIKLEHHRSFPVASHKFFDSLSLFTNYQLDAHHLLSKKDKIPDLEKNFSGLKLRLIVMWSVPFNLGVHSSYLAVGMVYNEGRSDHDQDYFSLLDNFHKHPCFVNAAIN